MMKAKKPRSSEEIAKEITQNVSINTSMPNTSMPKAKINPVSSNKASTPRAIKPVPPREVVPEVKVNTSPIKTAPPPKKIIQENNNVNKENETLTSNQLEGKLIKHKAPRPKVKNASQITQNQSEIHKNVQKNASNMILKPKVIETKNDINQTAITYTFTEKEMTTLVSAIVEGLSTQFVTKDEAAKVVIGTLSKIAMKDVPDEIVDNSIETTTDYIASDEVHQEENIKKDTFFSKLFKRKGGAS